MLSLTGPAGGLPGAAPDVLADLLSGPVRPARVLAADRYAVYLGLPPARQLPAVAVVTADAVRMPFAVRLGRSAPLPTPGPGPARVGAGAVVVGGLRVTVTRWWRPRPALPVLDPAAVAGWQAVLAEVAGEPESVVGLPGDGDVAALTAGLVDGDRACVVASAARLLGRGPGSTPSGDDVLATVLAALAVLAPACPAAGVVARRCGPPLAAKVRRLAAVRTTPLSAALLGWAARGVPTGEVADVLAAAAAGPGATRSAARRLVRIGHTSGADCLAGLLAVATAVVSGGPGSAVRRGGKAGVSRGGEAGVWRGRESAGRRGRDPAGRPDSGPAIRRPGSDPAIRLVAAVTGGGGG